MKNHASALLFKLYSADGLQTATDNVRKLTEEKKKAYIRQLAKEGRLNEINELLKGGGKFNV